MTKTEMSKRPAKQPRIKVTLEEMLKFPAESLSQFRLVPREEQEQRDKEERERAERKKDKK